MSFFDIEVVVVVFDAWSAVVVPNAVVSIINMDTSEFWSGFTDSAGSISFMLRSAQYNLFVAKAGFKEYSQLIGVGGAFQKIDIALIPDSGEPPVDPPVVVNLGVTVRNDAGQRLQGALVVVGAMSGLSNARGIVIFMDVAIAVFDWSVSLNGFHTSTGTVDTSKITNLNVTLVEVDKPPPPPVVEHTITVLVKDLNGQPLQNVRVSATRREGGFNSFLLSDSNGSVVFNRAPTGNYLIRAFSRSGAFEDAEVFVDSDVTVNLSVALEWILSISSSFGGGTVPVNRDHFYQDGAVVSVKANPMVAYKFVKWTLDGEEFTVNPINVEMTMDRSLHAEFVLVEGGDIVKAILVPVILLGGGIILFKRMIR